MGSGVRTCALPIYRKGAMGGGVGGRLPAFAQGKVDGSPAGAVTLLERWPITWQLTLHGLHSTVSDRGPGRVGGDGRFDDLADDLALIHLEALGDRGKPCGRPVFDPHRVVPRVAVAVSVSRSFLYLHAVPFRGSVSAT